MKQGITDITYAKLIEVIMVDGVLRGEGTEESPARRITQYWSRGGELLAEKDSWKEQKDGG